MKSDNDSCSKQKLPHLPSPNKKTEGDEREGGRKFLFQPLIWSSVGFEEDAYSCAE